MAVLGVILFSIASIGLLAFFDTLLYRQGFLMSVARLLSECVQLHNGTWILVAAAYLCAAWHDLAKWTALRRRKTGLTRGRRTDETWSRE